MAHQHSQHAAPPAGQTNATVAVKIAGESQDAPVPETHPGGLFYGADGIPHDANGNPLDGSIRELTTEDLLNELPPEHPLVQRQRAAERSKKKGPVAPLAGATERTEPSQPAAKPKK